jgi:uncharacterized heparinase superfamily protein
MRKTSRVFADAAEETLVEAERPVDLPAQLGEPWLHRRGERALVRDAMRGLLRIAGDALQPIAFGTPLYRLTLAGTMPDTVILGLIDPVPGRIAAANALFTGTWTLRGHVVRTAGRPPWHVAAPSEAWLEELHGFSWLRHYNAAQGDTAVAQARALTAGWLQRYGRWHAVAWRPHVAARRIIAWLSSAPLLFEGADMIWRCAVLRSLAEQARHLSRVAGTAPDGAPRIAAATGLAVSGLCLSEGKRRLERGLALALREIDLQILPDGGHVSRDPETHAQVLADLLVLKLAFAEARAPIPQALSRAVDRMAPMLSFFRHGDGRLALFNGAQEGTEQVFEALLARAGDRDAPGAPLSHARHSGYHRLTGGRTIVIIDAGTAPRGRFASRIHASALAFEMSIGAHRLIVNCGAAESRGGAWRSASRATAAHSTLTLADRSTMNFLTREPFVTWVGERPLEAPAAVASARADTPEGTWLVAHHDGYRELIHERRLYLDADGDDLRGEDRLVAPDARTQRIPRLPFTLRFHLHPDVRASLARDGQTILLLLPNGDGWRFRASRGAIALEKSIYLGRVESARKCEQIVVRSETTPAASPAALVRWAIRRLGARSRRAQGASA